IADRYKQGIPVILNLQNADTELSKRLIDFASGLTYALNGGMQRVADKVFLLTPRNVEVSAEQRAALLERGGFFNQAEERAASDRSVERSSRRNFEGRAVRKRLHDGLRSDSDRLPVDNMGAA